MAQRLATVYVKTLIRLSEAEMIEFMELFAKHHIHFQVKVFDNGNQEVVFENGRNEEITLCFERSEEDFLYEGTCRLSSAALTNAMREAISQFKGSAIVHRLYRNYTMIYSYDQGVVVEIVERRRDSVDNIVYQYKNTLGQLESLYSRRDVEIEIVQIRERINLLLDVRIQTDKCRRTEIDEQLRLLSHRLYVLEA